MSDIMLVGRDCVGVAKTGQGKTLAFAIPILQKLSVDPYGVFAVVLTPTRELAAQIGDSFSSVGAGMGLRQVVVTGGRDTIRQSQDLDRRPHVVVATPGRLADHIRNNSTLSLARVKYLVLDEADRLLAGEYIQFVHQATYAMVLVTITSYQRQVCQTKSSQDPKFIFLNEPVWKCLDVRGTCQHGLTFSFIDDVFSLVVGGFDSDLSSIISALPSSRQTLLFTATNSEAISTVIKSCPNDPFVWSSPDIHVSSTVDQLDQKFVLTPPEAKDSYLVQLLLSRREKESKSSCIVFCRTCRDAELTGNLLSKVGLPTSTLHSVKPQRERMSGLASFKSGHTKVLVATDVASRGLDIPQVDLVVNHHLPRAPVDYVHRVGRTARAGRGGQSVSLVTPHDVGLVLAVEQHTGVKMTELELDDSRVAEIMVQVNMLHREAQLQLEKEDWGEQRKVNVRKRKIEQGIDPDQEEKLRKKKLLKKKKQMKKGKLKSSI